ncbi:MAG: recombinase RecA [Eubacterium sp.]|nr:recombinase RecA [Eubacterium sp.]MCM1418424.1 recombinase RecA [Roseburia sp.]
MAKSNTPKKVLEKPTTPEEKQKALKAAIAHIEKQFGAGSVMRMGEKTALNVESIPTGSIGLDMALGIGGLPKGRIVEIFGPESGGKTTVTLHAIAETQKRGGIAAFVDVEHALDPVYAKALGVDLDQLLVSQPDTGEQALDIMEALVRSGAIDLIVLDSVAAIVTRAEIEGEMGDSFVGVQARLMSAALKRLTAVISKSNTVAVFINQLREKIGIMFGNPETTPGGRALKFYSSVRIEVRKGEPIKENGETIGNRTKVKVIKNKVAPPFKSCEFDMIFGHGISRLGEILDYAVELGFVKKSGAWFSYNDMRIGQGRENAKKFIGENPDIQAELEKKIMENAQQLDYSAGDDDDEAAEGAESATSAETAAKEEMSFTEAAELESQKKSAAKSGAKKPKAKKSVIVDADDDFEEFSIDEISGE